MTAALHQLKVIEMAGIGPCPLAGQLLADLGAEVTVIDRASTPADPTDINRRHKRSIALNLKSPEGLKAAQQLIAQADVLIEGFRPGVMEKLGLGPDECLSANPKLIYGRMTGWGQTGPLAQTAGHDLNYLAITGALHPIGAANQPPVPPLNLAADYGGGTMFLLLGILSALYERHSSGQGQVIDAAMVDGVPAMMGLLHTWFARNWWTTERESNFLDGGAPFYRCYTTADANTYLLPRWNHISLKSYSLKPTSQPSITTANIKKIIGQNALSNTLKFSSKKLKQNGSPFLQTAMLVLHRC